MKTICNPLKKYSKPDCKDNLPFEYQLPDEFRVDVVLKELCKSIEISSSVIDSDTFTSQKRIGIFF
jgi:deoxyribodipyrimidine photolyase-related protein